MTFDTSAAVMDALRAKLNTRKDADIARALGVTTATAAHWRTARSAMSPEHAMKAAAILGLPPAELVLGRLAESARSEEARTLYRELITVVSRRLKRAGRHAAALAFMMIGVTLGNIIPNQSHAASVSPTGYTLYEVA